MIETIKANLGTIFKDKRGLYWTSWKKENFKDLAFKHDKFSLSKKNVLRGVHGDTKTWKLMRCVYGKVYFVVVNNVKNSKFYKAHKTYILSHNQNKSILVPPNYGIGFYCLSKESVMHYKLSYKGKYVDAKNQFTIKWNSPVYKIKWPRGKKILSKRDA